MIKQKYTYKGNIYYIQEYAEFKHPETREWIPCVIYYCSKYGKRYVREGEEFFKLFERVD